MKNYSPIIVLILLIVLLLSSCKKDNPEPQDTQSTVNQSVDTISNIVILSTQRCVLTNPQPVPVGNITVMLYNTLTDMQSSSKSVRYSHTDSLGKLILTNLTNKQYYYRLVGRLTLGVCKNNQSLIEGNIVVSKDSTYSIMLQ